jgi:hypothetical protein
MKNHGTTNDKTPAPEYKRVSNREFITAWMTSKTKKEVAERCDSTVSAITVRASYLRQKGVELPTFHNAIDKDQDIDKLNKLVRKLQKRHD